MMFFLYHNTLFHPIDLEFHSVTTFEGDLVPVPTSYSHALLQDRAAQFNYLVPFSG